MTFVFYRFSIYHSFCLGFSAIVNLYRVLNGWLHGWSYKITDYMYMGMRVSECLYVCINIFGLIARMKTWTTFQCTLSALEILHEMPTYTNHLHVILDLQMFYANGSQWRRFHRKNSFIRYDVYSKQATEQ